MTATDADLFAGSAVAPPLPPGPCALSFEESGQGPAFFVARCVPCGWTSPPATARWVLELVHADHVEDRRALRADPT